MSSSDASALRTDFRNALNINVGILGHVDSGKTSLCRALSSVASTAAFDKNPQSVARGITLDLGFSSVQCDLSQFEQRLPPVVFKRYTQTAGLSAAQLTLVDCPGHASLIRTIIGGASIVDVMVLVLDATKGIQMQTNECLVLGEVLGRRLLVVLNKIDLFVAPPGSTDPEAERRALIDAKVGELRAFFAKTKWPEVAFVEVAASPGAAPTAERDEDDVEQDLAARIDDKKTHDATTAASQKQSKKKGKIDQSGTKGPAAEGLGEHSLTSPSGPINVGAIVDHVLQLVDPVDLIQRRGALLPQQREDAAAMKLEASVADPTRSSFIMYVDHCFGVKGQGTVLTGTIAAGVVAVGDDVLLPDLQITKKVKSLQVFHQSVREARQGDRVGLCVTGLDASLVERGILCSAAVDALTCPKGSVTVPIPPSPITDLVMALVRGAANTTAPLSLPHTLSSRSQAVGGCLVRSNCFVAAVRKVRFFKGSLLTNSASAHKFHMTIGHTTTMGTLRFFTCRNPYYNAPLVAPTPEEATALLEAQEASLFQLGDMLGDRGALGPAASNEFPFGFEVLEELSEDVFPPAPPQAEGVGGPMRGVMARAAARPFPSRPRAVFAIVQLESPIAIPCGVSHSTLAFLCGNNTNTAPPKDGSNGPATAPRGTTQPHPVLLASRLDSDIRDHQCRLAVEGSIVSVLADWQVPAGTPEPPRPTITRVTGTKHGIAQPCGPQALPLFANLGVRNPAADVQRAAGIDVLRYYLFTAFRTVHWRSLPLFKRRTKEFPLDRVVDQFTGLVRVPPRPLTAAAGSPTGGSVAAKSAADLSIFVRMKIFVPMVPVPPPGAPPPPTGGEGAFNAAAHTGPVEWGYVEAPFGQEGMLRVRFHNPVFQTAVKIPFRPAPVILLPFLKYPFATHSPLAQ